MDFTQALARTLEQLDDPAAGTDARAEFAARFPAALQRLERRRGLDSAEAESLMSALGAAQVQEWELALALLGSRHGAQPRPRRVVPLSVGTLRQRFHFVMSMGADHQRAR
jgi:hypothetical protein